MALLLLMHPLALAEGNEFSLNREDMIAIRADLAWEDLEPDIVHFDGHFEIRIRDWRATADRAVLYGKLDDPGRLVLDGKPARFEVSYLEGARTERVLAEAREIIYERESRLIRLSGDATLLQGDSLLRSKVIEYDIAHGRFRTEGEAGVRIKTEPLPEAGIKTTTEATSAAASKADGETDQ